MRRPRAICRFELAVMARIEQRRFRRALCAMLAWRRWRRLAAGAAGAGAGNRLAADSFAPSFSNLAIAALLLAVTLLVPRCGAATD